MSLSVRSRSTQPPMTTNPIMITSQDYDRLVELVDSHAHGRSAELAADLDDELARARVVDQTGIPPDIVTMNSRCVFRFTDTGEEREVTLVYPPHADVASGKISVLAPVGAALLGLAVGQSIRWTTPEGARTLELIALRYQPEAAGDYHL